MRTIDGRAGISSAMRQQALRETFGNNICDLLAHSFIARVFKLLFRLKIQQDDFSSLVHDDEQASILRLHLDQFFFGSLAHGNVAGDGGSSHDSIHGVLDGRCSDPIWNTFPSLLTRSVSKGPTISLVSNVPAHREFHSGDRQERAFLRTCRSPP